MKIFEDLNLPTDKPFICTIASPAGIGKTTLLTMLASDLIHQGKKVLFISEFDERHILKKFNNLINPNFNTGKLRVLHNFNSKTLFEKIRGYNFEYIFLDISDDYSEKFLNEIQSICVSHRISFCHVSIGETFHQ